MLRSRDNNCKVKVIGVKVINVNVKGDSIKVVMDINVRSNEH